MLTNHWNLRRQIHVSRVFTFLIARRWKSTCSRHTFSWLNMSSCLNVLVMSICWLYNDANKSRKTPTPNTRFPSVHFSDRPTSASNVWPMKVDRFSEYLPNLFVFGGYCCPCCCPHAAAAVHTEPLLQLDLPRVCSRSISSIRIRTHISLKLAASGVAWASPKVGPHYQISSRVSAKIFFCLFCGYLGPNAHIV